MLLSQADFEIVREVRTSRGVGNSMTWNVARMAGVFSVLLFSMLRSGETSWPISSTSSSCQDDC